MKRFLQGLLICTLFAFVGGGVVLMAFAAHRESTPAYEGQYRAQVEYDIYRDSVVRDSAYRAAKARLFSADGTTVKR